MPLQPLDGFQIQVVGGLVQEEQVGRGGELGREPHTAPLPTGKSPKGAAPGFFGVEPQPLENGIHPGTELVSAIVLKALLGPVEAFQIFLTHSGAQLLQALRLPGQGPLQIQEVAVSRRRRLPDGPGVAEVPVLVQEGHSESGPSGDGTGRGVQGSGDETKEGCFSGAVAPHDSPALPGSHREAHIGEEGVGPEGHSAG